MQKNLLLDEDSQSDNSFDSSQICSSVTRTVSVLSNLQLETISQKFMSPKPKTRSIDSNFSQRTQSIEQLRIQINSQKPFLQDQPDFQLGFFIGKNKKNVQLNQSKIKKGINFFDDDQITLNQNLFPNNSLFELPQKTSNYQLNQELVEFSIPCFKNIGKNKKLQIDPNLLQKGKNFFDDDFEDPIFQKLQKQLIPAQSDLLSFQKPTKVKKTFITPKINEQNFAKTVNMNKKQKKQQIVKVQKKKIFDWNKFQVSSKKFLANQESFKICSGKKSQNTKSKKTIFKKINFEAISINQLRIQVFQNESKFKEFKERLQNPDEKKFDHSKKDCKMLKCILCDLNIEDVVLDRDELERVFSQKLIIEKMDGAKFRQLYQQICFKLLKYETYFIEIINKRFHPSNILVQLHKKSKLIQTGTPFLGWIDFCINEQKFYHSFIAEVRNIYHSDKINTYFILLADGWSNVWAVVTEKNFLYKFIHKLHLLSKIFIGYWKNYPLSNILSFCPQAKQGAKCIEIWYNSSIILNYNIKLGKPKSLIFYRPLNLNRKDGGIIPTVQGVVIRMFCQSAPRPKSSLASVDQNTFNDNYIQIITPEGFSVMIKFVLSAQRSLAELFRLYFRYHFYFVKIGQKDNFLQFNDEISKFFEFQKKDKNEYDPGLIQTLKKRYINSMDSSCLDQVQIGKWYDLRLEGKNSTINGRMFFIDNGNEPENTNCFFKGSVVLYQQYQLEKIEMGKKKQQDGSQKMEYYFKKTKFSNTLKSLPGVYEKLNQVLEKC